MKTESLSYLEQIQNLDEESSKRYLAFELGVIEFYDKTILAIDKIKIDSIFLNFLIFYSNYQYKGKSKPAFDFWQVELKTHLFLKERKLGFDSINNQMNEDGSRNECHFAGRYIKEAVL